MRLGRGTLLVTSEGATTRLPRPVEGSRPGRPRLGRTRVTKHEQRWANVRRAGRRWVTPGEAEATCCLLRLGRGTSLVASGGATTQLPRPVEESRPEARQGRTRVTKHEQRWEEMRRTGCQ
ncbi:hypothetical protein NDU88_005371 [Pleurodeles waltl]|uniref:Uncharacterized protein n=1 Tax=Pleurodeles waltl TaxID=8319 RepID=A0AAV7LNX4_PLEWA|nr:hypothetical protein NDU88_005371 [Pleurodeles waltl]